MLQILQTKPMTEFSIRLLIRLVWLLMGFNRESSRVLSQLHIIFNNSTSHSFLLVTVSLMLITRKAQNWNANWFFLTPPNLTAKWKSKSVFFLLVINWRYSLPQIKTGWLKYWMAWYSRWAPHSPAMLIWMATEFMEAD